MDRKLNQFLAVAELGNVSLAAEALHVSQPTVSANLKRLEEDYGVTLFLRNSRGVLLTEFGKVLYEHARGMDRLSKHALAEIHDLKTRRRTSLRFGCGHVWWAEIVRPAMAALEARGLDVSWHIEICSSLEGISGLLSGDLSVFLGTRVQRLQTGITLEFEPLFETHDRFFAHASHPLHGATVPLDALNAYPRLDVAPYAPRHFGIAEQDHDRLASRWEGFRPAVYSANSIMVGLDILRGGPAWLYYTAEAAPRFAESDILPLDVMGLDSLTTDIGLYRLPEKTPTPELSAFLEAMRERALEAG
ncbi:MAG: LysR family transcriptional regulator [Pseudomonadota bacterium]